MQVGMSLVFQNHDRSMPDSEIYEKELELAKLCEPLGFDSIWTTEHHFTDYMLIPDPIQFLTYMAGITSSVKLGTMVVVLPWHDPVRVAEQITMLDLISKGRTIFGVGRGAGDVEFSGFNVPMSESRERFIESATLIKKALSSGNLGFDGQYIKRQERQLRPMPYKSFQKRTFAAALSPESAEIMAKLGFGLMIIPQKPWEKVAKEIETHRECFRKYHQEESPDPIASAWIFCDEDPVYAEKMARKYIGQYYVSTINHYKFDGKHFAQEKGYEYYNKISQSLEGSSNQEAAQKFVDLQVWGTPDQCLKKIDRIKKLTNCQGFNGVFRYAGLDYKSAEKSLRLFSSEVMPQLQQVGYRKSEKLESNPETEAIL